MFEQRKTMLPSTTTRDSPISSDQSSKMTSCLTQSKHRTDLLHSVPADTSIDIWFVWRRVETCRHSHPATSSLWLAGQTSDTSTVRQTEKIECQPDGIFVALCKDMETQQFHVRRTQWSHHPTQRNVFALAWIVRCIHWQYGNRGGNSRRSVKALYETG